MDDQFKAGIEAVDKAAEKCNSILTGYFDAFLRLLKSQGTILGYVERIASRFCIFAALFCGLLYIVMCLKNMFFSFFFQGAPAGMCFGMALGSLIALAICSYAAAKMMDALSKVISSSTCKMSSLNFFSVLAAIAVLYTVIFLLAGIFMAIRLRSLQIFFYGLGATAFSALLTLYFADPEKFGIVADENASAGEDFVSIFTFALKVMLRLVPVALLVLSVIGVIRIVPMIFTTYIQSGESTNRFLAANMVADMTATSRFVFIGLLPLAVYLIYIFYYVLLDLVRAILQLPGKLDALKK